MAGKQLDKLSLPSPWLKQEPDLGPEQMIQTSSLQGRCPHSPSAKESFSVIIPDVLAPQESHVGSQVERRGGEGWGLLKRCYKKHKMCPLYISEQMLKRKRKVLEVMENRGHSSEPSCQANHNLCVCVLSPLTQISNAIYHLVHLFFKNPKLLSLKGMLHLLSFEASVLYVSQCVYSLTARD